MSRPSPSPTGAWARRVEIETGLRQVLWEECECDYGNVVEITVSGTKLNGTRVEVRERFRVRLSDRIAAYEVRAVMCLWLLARLRAQPPITRALLDGMRADDPEGYRRLIAVNPDVGRWHRRPAPPPDVPPSDTGLDGAIPLPDVEPQNYGLLAGAAEVSDEAWAAQNRRINDALYRGGG